MGKVYQVLLIEDDERDAELIEIELKKLKIEIELEIIHQRKQLEDRLENSPPDLIVSDYNLPSFNAIQALKLVREKDPHLPFILVSGYIGEEKAVDAMLEGTSDYAMKSNLDRLGPAIKRELTNYEEQKKKTRQLALTRERYESLVQSVDGIVWEADADTFQFFYVSPQSKDLLGYSPEQWLHDPDFWKSHIHPKDRSRVIDFCRNKTQQGENHRFEYRMISADQEVVWLRDYVTVETKRGEPDRLRGFMVDITNEKKAEKQRDKAYQIADIGHWELDLVHQQLHWSNTVRRLHEVPSDYEPDLDTAIDFYKAGEHRQNITEAVEQAIQTGRPFDEELKIVTAAGNEKWVRVVGETEFRNGQCARIYGSTQDITRRKEAEQKLREVVEHSTNMFYRHDTDHLLTYVSPQSEQFLGYSPEEAKQQWTEFVTDHPINEEGFRHTQKAIETGQVQPAFPLQLQKKNGEIIWVRVNEAPLTEDGETVAIVGSLTDITEQKKYEQKLQESLERYDYATRATSDAIWDWDLQENTVFWGSGFESLFGYDLNNLSGDSSSWTEHIHPEDREWVYKSIKETIEGDEQNWFEEYRYMKADGSFAYVEDRGFVIRDDNGKATRMIGAMRDVTEEKKAKQQIKDVNKKLETAQQIAKLGYWEMNVNTEEIYWSDQTYNIFGLNPDEDTVDLETVLHHIHPDEYREVVEQNEQAIENRESLNLEHRIMLADGSVKWIQVIGNFDDPDNGAPVMEGTIQDITQKKKLERLLQQAHKMARIGAWEVDLKTEEILWTSMTREIHEIDDPNFAPDLETGITFYKKGESRETIRRVVQRAITEGIPWDEELQIVTAKGNERWVRTKGEPHLVNGECLRLYGSFQDIHDRKEAEQKLQHVADNIPGAIFQYRLYPDGTDELMYLSKGAKELWGISPEMGMQHNELIWDQLPEADYQQVKQSIADSAEAMAHWNAQWRSRHPEKGIRWHEGNGIPRKLPDGSIVWDSIILDITEQKQAEQQITKINNKLKLAQEIASLGYWELDLETGNVYWSEQSYKIWEFDPKEVQLTTDLVFDRMHPDDREYFRKQHEKTLETGQPLDLEHRILLPDGTVKWIHVLGELKTSAQGRPIAMEGTAQDITKEKEAQIQLEKAYQENETILESIGDAFFAVDENWIVTYWNKEAEQILDKPKEEIIGKNLWEEYDDAVDLDFYTQYHKAVNENVSVSFEEYYPGVEKWFEVSAYPSKTGLSVYFRDITDKKKRVEKIRQVNERFEKVTEATNDAIWDFDVAEGELFWGRGFETLFRYDLEETNPTLDFLINLIHPEDRGEIVQKIEEYMQPGTKTDWYEEYRFKKADGSYAPVMDRAVFIRDDRGEVTRVVGAMTDLTRQKKNEEALRQLNRELEKHAEELAASNAELEQFAYVASHDLQEPLRMVSSFLKRLEKKYGDQLDEKARQYIDFAVDGAGRMRQIILDLLNYSRVGQHEFERQNLCLEELLNEILKLEHRAIEESGATVEWDPLPEIRAAETPVQQVFQNLIRNAIKYRRPECEPEIHISGEETGTHWKFSVSDNGIGIREEFQENIFNIFQRLHTQEEYSGTGIGLAVSKKIVEKHGGEIWVESEEGEGSTFYFTIAKE
ncbi:PAS domain-containing protein [Halalkalibaculum sp. DA384]|uniref:PAS domain-containing protein n=1 Tax=Halalkalibaculum sp. DA384 TaxID=3373606 RepID=UPI0037542A3F